LRWPEEVRQVSTILTEEDIRIAQEFQATLTEDEIDSGTRLGDAMRNPSVVMSGIRPYEPEKSMGQAMGSTDVGDVSWVTPTAQFLTACYAWGTPFHSWQLVAQGKMSLAHKGMVLAAETLASAAIDLFSKPKLLETARIELEERRNHRPYVCPIPSEVLPPPLR